MKSKNKMLICGLLSTFLVIGSIIVSNNEPSIQTSSVLELSTKKIEWGIKRGNNHEQPDLGSKNKSLIEKYNGMAMGNNNDKYIYVTFDLGYEAGYTENILNTLKENNVNATFFITAHYANSASDLVQKMINDGHIIGNHTVNHKSMPALSEDELTKELMNLHTAIYEKFGYEMKYIRPPMGEFSERTLQIIKTLGYTTTMWSLAYDDWDENKQGREAYGKDKVISNIHNGAIILLHANSKDNSNILR